MSKTRTLVSVLGLLIGSYGLFGCNSIATPDGKIPATYLDKAKEFAGIYQGEFNGITGEILLRLEGDVPSLTFTSTSGHDLLGPSCNSSIGELAQIDTTLTGDLSGAVFNFDPGKCQIEGRTVELDFDASQDGKIITVSIIKDHTEAYIPGGIDCSAGAHGHEHCLHSPSSWQTVYKRISGKFKKLN